jgi:hypothetical protein
MRIPITQIPDDVLALIFKCCSEPGVIRGFGQAVPWEGMSWTDTIICDGAPFEILATHVTHCWRDMAINLAPLWNNMYILVRGWGGKRNSGTGNWVGHECIK